jgi:glycolate oxidase
MKQRGNLAALPLPAGATLHESVLANMPVFDSDNAGLLADLALMLPPERFVTSPAALFAYNCDAQTLDTALPLAVVFPQSTEEVSRIVKAAHHRGVPFLARGAGTGLSGGAVAVGALVIATSRLGQIEDVDLKNRQAWVGPGVVNAHLSRCVAHAGLHYAPDPSSQNACTIGGNVAENAGGPHTLKYGVTTNHILAVEVVLPNGDVVTLGSEANDTPGYDLVSAFVGCEGTFGIATRILVRLTPLPEGVKTALAVFGTVRQACNAVTGILATGVVPAAIEMIDKVTLRAVEDYIHAGFPLDAAAVLLVEVDGIDEDLDAQLATVVMALEKAGAQSIRHAKDHAERMMLWKARKQAFGAIGRIAPNYYTHDGVIPRSRLPEVLDEIYLIGERHDVLVANVFHAGDGNLHPVVLYDERVDGIIHRVRAAGDEILRLVLSVGGSLSGEHGIGLEKIGYMTSLFSECDLDEMRLLRHVFNPDELCNPGKVLPMPGRCVELGGSKNRPMGL